VSRRLPRLKLLTAFQDFEDRSASELLSWALESFGEGFAIASSFQREDMVLVDLAAHASAKFRVFTLDTGRLHEETYQMMEEVRRRYGIVVETVFPDHLEVERMVAQNGPNLFYLSTEFRHLCCDTRKTRPLGRKLQELRAWATGLRRQQSATRSHIPKVEEAGGIVKLSPLADWTAAQVEEYTKAWFARSSPVQPGLRLHRVRALHARHPARRRRARRALVVGTQQQGVRDSFCRRWLRSPRCTNS